MLGRVLANFLECREGEVRSAPSPGPKGMILEGPLTRTGIISVLCMRRYEPSTLYIRHSAV
jgi:hypothetical protein